MKTFVIYPNFTLPHLNTYNQAQEDENIKARNEIITTAESIILECGYNAEFSNKDFGLGIVTFENEVSCKYDVLYNQMRLYTSDKKSIIVFQFGKIMKAEIVSAKIKGMVEFLRERNKSAIEDVRLQEMALLKLRYISMLLPLQACKLIKIFSEYMFGGNSIVFEYMLDNINESHLRKNPKVYIDAQTLKLQSINDLPSETQYCLDINLSEIRNKLDELHIKRNAVITACYELEKYIQTIDFSNIERVKKELELHELRKKLESTDKDTDEAVRIGGAIADLETKIDALDSVNEK